MATDHDGIDPIDPASTGNRRTNDDEEEEEEDESGRGEPNEKVLAYLSFSTDNPRHNPLATSAYGSTTPSNRNHHNNHGNGRRRLSEAEMQGVLWKRRDVFRNRWRPRWFVLHPHQGILTYYLLNENSSQLSATTTTAPPSGGSTTTGGLRHRHHGSSGWASPARAATTSGTSGASSPFSAAVSPIVGNRGRTNSDISMDTIDYDVVPRGSIFLGAASCTVEANEALTRPEEQLYALTITDRDTSKRCYLAARSSTARDQWLERIRQVIQKQRQRHQHEQQQQQQQMQGLPEAPPPPQLELELPPEEERFGASHRSDPPSTATRSIDADDSGPPGPPPPPPSITTTATTTTTTASHPAAAEPPVWTTVDAPELTQGVPPSVAARIDDLLQRYLPDATQQDHPDWAPGTDAGDGVLCSKHRSLPMIRSFYRTTHHHPAEYLQLVWDLPRTLEFETNVRSHQRLNTWNDHTCLVHTSYHPVWPTSPREFCSTVHWRLVRLGGGEPALCVVAFSCDDDALAPPRADHVRGTLHVSLSLWRPLLDKGGGCTHARLLSYDLNGQIPRSLNQTILQQQASMPQIMDVHLRQSKRASASSLFNEAPYKMDYESLRRALREMPCPTSSPRKKSSKLRQEEMVLAPSPNKTPRKRVGSNNTPASPTTTNGAFYPLMIEAAVLFAPLLLQRAMQRTMGFSRLEALVFVVSCACAARWILLRHVLRHYRVWTGDASDDPSAGSFSCRFVVDQSGIRTFLANEHQTRIDLDEEGLAPLKTEHVVLYAVASALEKHTPLAVRKPFSWLPPLLSKDLLWRDDVGSTPRPPVWLPSDRLCSLPEIAEFLQGDADPARADRFGSRWCRSVFGAGCEVWTMEHEPGREIETSVCEPAGTASPISVVVSSTASPKKEGAPSAERENNNENNNYYGGYWTNGAKPARPPVPEAPRTLVSITFRSTKWSAAGACRGFAEEVRRLLDAPESCDE